MAQVKKIILVLSKFGGITEVCYDSPISIERAEKEIVDSIHFMWVLELTNGKKIKYVYGKRQKAL